jgi:hypothetical protein
MTDIFLIVGLAGFLYFGCVQVPRGVKHLGCLVKTGHKCKPKPKLKPWQRKKQ